MVNKTLALAIPTYNRPSVLHENLARIIPELKMFQIPVYISDDSSDDDTLKMVQLLQMDYEFIFYRKNTPSLGHDQNCLATLIWPNQDYIWYMGDSIYFCAGSLSKLIKILTLCPTFVFINSYVKSQKYSSGFIQNNKEFLIDTTWFLTLSGATVYSKKVVDSMKNQQIGNTIYKNFMQLGLIMDYLFLRGGNIYWWDEKIIQVNTNKKSYWSAQAVNVFVIDWIHFIENLPIFDNQEKEIIIKSHSRETKLFGLKNLLRIRADGGISFSILFNHRSPIAKAFHIPLIFVVIVCMIPSSFLRFIRFIIKNIKI
jgi:hypothetical protein